MSVSVAIESHLDSLAALRASGFESFQSVAQLIDSRCLEVPVSRGVYLVVRERVSDPEFLARSVGGHFRHQDPTVPIDDLHKKWIKGAIILYIGRARGPGVRSLLQQRVKRYMRFGQGRNVAHWGGRYIWQLRDHAALLASWLPTPDEDPANVEARLLSGFCDRYGRLPFANLRQESEE